MGRTSISEISFCFVTLLASITIQTNALPSTCNEYQQCADGTFGGNYTTIFCNGFQSCMNVKNSVVSVNAQCYGAQSCMNITQPYLQVGTIECHGYESCMDSEFLMDGDMECYGEKSCFRTSVTIKRNLNDDDGPRYLNYDCLGSLSCAESTFAVNVNSSATTTTFTSHDAFAFYNTTIDSTSSLLELELGGYYSGWNLTVICGKQSDYPSCNVTCMGTGCYNSRILCIDDDYCRISCNDTAGNLCPLNVTYENSTSIFVNNNLTLINHENSIISGNYFFEYDNNHNVSVDFINVELTNDENYCLNSTLGDGYVQYCNDYRACYNTTYIDNNNKSICCHSNQACAFAYIKTPTWNFGSSQNQIPALIRCDGEAGCQQISIYANNTIACGAYQSCELSSLITVGDMYCNAYYACRKSSITNAARVFCNSESSCYQTTIARAKNVYAFAYQALQGATINSDNSVQGSVLNVYLCSYSAGSGAAYCCYSDTTCNFHCSSNEACEGLTLSGTEGCDEGTINFIHNSSIIAQECQVYVKQGSENFGDISTTGYLWVNGSSFWSSETGNETDSGENGGNGANSNNKTIEIVLIVVVTLIVIAVSVGLVLYFMKNRRTKSAPSQQEQQYSLLDKR